MKYKVWDIVSNKVDLKDENGNLIPAGTLLRIVAIAPKVRVVKGDPRYYDNKAMFYNAVRVSQENNYSNRIRADFITLSR